MCEVIINPRNIETIKQEIISILRGKQNNHSLYTEENGEFTLYVDHLETIIGKPSRLLCRIHTNQLQDELKKIFPRFFFTLRLRFYTYTHVLGKVTSYQLQVDGEANYWPYS